jgi:ribosomal protein S18 acetylase RimI-like enzyme
VDVELVPLDAADFTAFAARVVPSYAAAKVAAGEWDATVSLDLARADFEERLPHGLKTEGHALLGVHSGRDGRLVGDLWLEYRSEAGKRVCAVLDLYIEPVERRRGYGWAALLAAETMARSAGAEAMRLTVLGDNEAARALYASAGYYLLNARLTKPLGASPR